MAYGTRVTFEPVRELAAASIGAAYVKIGTPTIAHTRIVRIVNSTNADVYVSVDGVTNDLRVAASSFVLYDFSANLVQDDGLFLQQGTQFWVKETSAGAPSTGEVWIEVIYASGGV